MKNIKPVIYMSGFPCYRVTSCSGNLVSGYHKLSLLCVKLSDSSLCPGKKILETLFGITLFPSHLTMLASFKCHENSRN